MKRFWQWLREIFTDPVQRAPLFILIAFVITGFITMPLETILFFNFIYIGLMVFIGMVMTTRMPRKKYKRGRRITQWSVGLYLVLLVCLVSANNLQIEGFFFSLLLGTYSAALVHYAVSKVIGPVIFGRSWCGWTCWTGMVLDLLPHKRSPGRRQGLGWMKYLHFGLSFGLVAFLVFVVGYRPELFMSMDMVLFFAAGNVAYYVVAIGMALVLKDNRAFCKYMCPVAVPLKVASQFSVVKVQTDTDACNGCNACTRMCPMDIDILAYVEKDRRVMSSDCIMCATCVAVCTKDALKLSVELDGNGENYLRLLPSEESD